MPSAIDITVPVHGNPTTQSVRDNFSVVRDELNNFETLAGLKLNRSGDTMAGPFTLWGNPTANYHAANMSWVINQIKSTVNTLIYVGDYDAQNDVILSSGQVQFIVGTALPLAAAQNSQFYFTVTTTSAPTKIGNQPVGGVIAGTWLISNGESWTDFAMAAPGVTAQVIPIDPPIPNITSDNVYDALNEIMWNVSNVKTDALSRSQGGAMYAMLTLFGDPVSPLDAVTKQYVDSKAFIDAPNDANYYARHANGWASVLPITGGTIAGDLYANNLLSSNSIRTTRSYIDTPPGTERDLIFQSNGSTRWYLYTSGHAETGGDAGSNFGIAYANDSGGYKGLIFSADRLGTMAIQPSVALNLATPTVNVTGNFSVLNNKTIATAGQLQGGYGLFGKGGATSGGFVGSWNAANNNYFGIMTANGKLNFGNADLNGNMGSYWAAMDASGFLMGGSISAVTNIYATTSLVSGGGRVGSQSGSNPSVYVYDTAQGYCAGMFLGGAKNLYFGPMDGNGAFGTPIYGRFDSAGNFFGNASVNAAVNITSGADIQAGTNLFAASALYINYPTINDFIIFRDAGFRYFQWTTNWYDSFQESNGTRSWYCWDHVGMQLTGGELLVPGNIASNTWTCRADRNFLLTNSNGYLLQLVGGTYMQYNPGNTLVIAAQTHGLQQLNFLVAAYLSSNSTGAWKPGGGPWSDSSDARIKRITGEYKSGLAEIIKLEPRKAIYLGNDIAVSQEGLALNREKRKASPDTTPALRSHHKEVAEKEQELIGFVAQEVEMVMPEMVTYAHGTIDDEFVEDLRVVDTQPLTYAFVNAFKEIEARLRRLETTK